MEEKDTPNVPESEDFPKQENKEKQEPDLFGLNMQELVNYAELKGVDTYGKTRKELLVSLGASGVSGGKAYVRPKPGTEKLQYLRSRGHMEPENTIFPAEDFDTWMLVIAEDPLAFNGADLTDRNAPIQHTFRPKGNKCACGAKVDFPRREDNPKEYMDMVLCPGVMSITMVHGRPVQKQVCMGGKDFRKWLLHKIPKLED